MTNPRHRVYTFSPETPVRAGDNLWVKSVKSVLICIGNQESGKQKELLELVVQETTLHCKILTSMPFFLWFGSGWKLKRHWFSKQVLTLFNMRY